MDTPFLYYWLVVFQGINSAQSVDPCTVEGLLGYHLQFGVIMNKPAVNILYRFLWEHTFSFLWEKCQSMQLLGHMISTLLGL